MMTVRVAQAKQGENIVEGAKLDVDAGGCVTTREDDDDAEKDF